MKNVFFLNDKKSGVNNSKIRKKMGFFLIFLLGGTEKQTNRDESTV